MAMFRPLRRISRVTRASPISVNDKLATRFDEFFSLRHNWTNDTNEAHELLLGVRHEPADLGRLDSRDA